MLEITLFSRQCCMCVNLLSLSPTFPQPSVESGTKVASTCFPGCTEQSSQNMSPTPGQVVGAPMICGRQYEANIISLLLVESCTRPSQSTHHIQHSKIKKY